jgi:hypothetical protein
MFRKELKPQSRQSAKLLLQVFGIGTPPLPHPQANVPHPPLWSRGEGARSHAGEGVGGGSQFRREDITLWYSVPSNAQISTPLFQKTAFFSKIFFGKPPSKFLEVCLNPEYM